MGGDYTRFTFNPRQHQASVLLQQGRVQLDADLNELVEIVDRYRRAEAYDLIGRTGVSRLSMPPGATAPESFQIRLQAGNFTIGRGRIYVDGIQAENHGSGNEEIDEVLDELRGSQTTPVNQQPHLGTANPQNELSAAGLRLAYLDVWRRELTAVEHPLIVEKAVGVDTSTRVQTAWQVRVLPGALPGGTTCATDWSTIAAWNQATRRSAARLTTLAVQPVAPSDPCLVAPTGGYRGLENRLYRIEVHDDGTAGTLTLKWSRDNASVASRVLGIDGTNRILNVERVGRDRVMRFATDQWVEIIDDAREFDGRPGVMRRVASTDDVNSTITLTAALTGIDMTRNPRIRRWDQTQNLNSDGLIPVSAFPATIDLEDGVRVELRLTGGGNARVGDYWVFAARTADASVEPLNQAPPRGIRHHYTPLAIVDGDIITDCRTIFPAVPTEAKSCDCTVCVSVQQQENDPTALQQAVNQVRNEGGKVCLEAGIYPLEQPLDIRDARSVRVVGKGYKTILVYEGAGAAVTIQDSKDVQLADLSVVTFRGDDEPTFGIALRDIMRARIDRCFVVQDFWLVIGGLLASGSEGPAEWDQLRREGLTGGMAIALSGPVADTAIRDCMIAGETGIGGLTPGRSQQIEDAQPIDDTKFDFAAGYLATFRLVIEANGLACIRAGIDFGTSLGIMTEIGDMGPIGLTLHSGETRVVNNDIVGCLDVGIAMLGRVLALGEAKAGEGSAHAEPTWLPTSARVEVRGNTLVVLGDGINVRGDRTRVADNDVAGMRGEGVTGIIVNRKLSRAGVSGCVVSDNRVSGMAGGDGIEIGAGDDLRVTSNAIDSVGGDGIHASIRRLGTAELAIVDNEVTGVGERAGREDQIAAGIAVNGAQGVDVSRNLVRRVATEVADEAERAGIRMLGCNRMRIVSNQVYEIGPSGDFGGTSKGIEVVGAWDRLDVIDNSVQAPLDSGRGSRWYAISIGSVNELERRAGPVTHRRALRVETDAADEERAIVGVVRGISRFSPVVIVGRPDGEGPFIVTDVSVEPIDPGRSLTAISGNLFDARGRTEAVLVVTAGNLSFQDNRCLLASSERSTPVARLYAIGAVIVNANHVEGQADIVSVDIQTSVPPQPVEPHATVVANIATGRIELNGNPLQNPWAPLNLEA